MKNFFVVLIFLMIMFMATGTVSAYQISHWKLDEGYGTTAGDASGNGNYGVLFNNPTWTTGKLGGATFFDGMDDYIKVGNSGSEPFDLSGTFSTSLWFNTSDTYGKLLNKAGDQWHDIEFRLRTTSTTNMQYQFWKDSGVLNSSNTTFDFTYTQDAWNHLVIVRDDIVKTVKIYMDGVNVVDDTYIGTPMDNDYAFYMGAGENSIHTRSDIHYKGLLDDVRIYDVALSETEIHELYNTSSDNTPTIVNPEPSTIILIGLGFAGMVGIEARRRRKKSN